MGLDTIIYISLGIVFFVGMSVAMAASANFLDAIKKRELMPCSIHMTASEFVVNVIIRKNLRIRVVKTAGRLTDFYSSKGKIIAISQNFWDSRSLVALAIAAHEAGHAITDKQHNATFIIHRALARFCRLLNGIFYLILTAGFVCLAILNKQPIYYQACFFSAAGIVLLTLLLRLITVQNESNASRIGEQLLKEYGASNKEIRAARKIYSAALTTYIGAIFMPLVKILRFVLDILYNTVGKLFR